VVTDSVERIGDNAFIGCTSLKSISFGNQLTEIGSQTFWGCKSLTKLSLPDSLKRIGPSAFAYCGGLSKATIGKKLEAIGASAFSGCYNLNQVLFTGNAPSVESAAFSGMNSDCTTYVPWGSTGWDVVIPGTWNGIKIAYSFMGTNEVTEEELPETVAIQSGADVKVSVNHEMLEEQLKALIARCFAMSKDPLQETNCFKVSGDYDAAQRIVTLKTVIDEEKIGLAETLAEVADEESLSAYKDDGTMRLTSVKDGFYYGLAAAESLEDMDNAVEKVKSSGLAQAVDGEVSLSADKPTGGTVFFKVIVSDEK